MRYTGKILIIIVISVLLQHQTGIAQQVMEFSLREAQIYALENNYDVINALKDIEIARAQVDETISTGLPQISGTIGYNNYLEIPTQLIPGEFFGEEPGTFIPVQFGTQHNLSLTGQVNQMVFNGQYLVGLQAAQAFLSLSHTSYEKSLIEIKNLIATAYYPIVILQENTIVFDSTLITLKDMLYETTELYKAGFLEDTDVDQLKLLISNMETTVTNIDNQLEISRNTLKFLMGLEADQEIILTDRIDDLMPAIDREYLIQSRFDYGDHIDYIMLTRQEDIAELEIKQRQAAYYPLVNAFYSYSQNAMRSQFNFLAGDRDWFATQILGLQIDIPIWSSGNRKHRIQQKKLALDKILMQKEQLRKSLELKVITARSEFNNAYLTYQNKKMALDNAENIYEKARVKYSNGLLSSLELSQTYNQYLNGQVNYLTAMQTLLMKKSNLEKELTDVNE